METNERMTEITISHKSSEWWNDHKGKLVTVTLFDEIDDSKGIVLWAAAGLLFLDDSDINWSCPLHTINKIKFHSLEEGIIWKLTNE